MRIHNIYADENGETHFRDIDIEMSEMGPDATESAAFGPQMTRPPGRPHAPGDYWPSTA